MEKKSEVLKIDTYELSSPSTLIALASELSRFLTEKKLVTLLQGKQFVQVEGWQFAGLSLGIIPIAKNPINTSTDTLIRFECEVDLINIKTGAIVGHGHAICANNEPGKKGFPEYAVSSMAQTRAVGKAYRLLLGWLMKAAGFEPTPAEEMDGIQQNAAQRNTARQQETETPTDLATPLQKANIVKLLNHPMITMDEKNKMLVNMNRFDEERADQAIIKLEASIKERAEKLTA